LTDAVIDMALEWQFVAVGLAIAASACYLGRTAWRAWHPGAKGCHGGCGCATKPSSARPSGDVFVPSAQLTIRRKTEA
jgi:hypothetical protein